MRIDNNNYEFMKRTLQMLGKYLTEFATSMGCNKRLVQTKDDRYKGVPNKENQYGREYEQFKQEFLNHLIDVNVRLNDLGIDPIVIDYDGVMMEFKKTQKGVNDK